MDELLAWRTGSVIVDAVAGARRRPVGIGRRVRGVTVLFRRVRGIETMRWKRPRRVSR
jgi:hypothetical protein